MQQRCAVVDVVEQHRPPGPVLQFGYAVDRGRLQGVEHDLIVLICTPVNVLDRPERDPLMGAPRNTRNWD